MSTMATRTRSYPRKVLGWDEMGWGGNWCQIVYLDSEGSKEWIASMKWKEDEGEIQEQDAKENKRPNSCFCFVFILTVVYQKTAETIEVHRFGSRAA